LLPALHDISAIAKSATYNRFSCFMLPRSSAEMDSVRVHQRYLLQDISPVLYVIAPRTFSRRRGSSVARASGGLDRLGDAELLPLPRERVHALLIGSVVEELQECDQVSSSNQRNGSPAAAANSAFKITCQTPNRG
jgi:hypothetical protein